MRSVWFAAVGALMLVVTACAQPGTGSSLTGSGDARPAGPKRVTAVVASQAMQIAASDTVQGGTYQGGDAIEELVNSGLTVKDNQANLWPRLAEAVPSFENKLWRVNPDGTMETTWRLKPGIVWHDGTPFTSEDLRFTLTLARDKETLFYEKAVEPVDSIDTPDDRTITLHWKQAYVSADRIFMRSGTMPRPKHLLAPTYAENKAALPLHAYWGEAYVGTGPFKVRKFEPSSHLILEANDRYVMGRPKIDEIEIRFIPDSNTITANLLAGEVELTMGRALTLDEAMQVRDRWKGQVAVGYKNWIVAYPQLMNPDPQVLLNVQFRRAIMYALDRQQLVDELEYGMTKVAHVFLNPRENLYKEIEASLVKYDFDSRRSAQMIQELGYARGSDGLFRDAAGKDIPIEVRTNTGHESRILAIADQLRSAGLASTPYVATDAQRRSAEYDQTFPGLRLWRRPNEPETASTFHSSQIPLPENRFTGGNYARYVNPTLDGYVEKYLTTLSFAERGQHLAQAAHILTDQVIQFPIYYNIEPAMIGARLRNVTPRETEAMTEAWNAYEWDVM